MTTWAERLLTCIHGVKEGLDSHACPECIKLCKMQQHEHAIGITHIYLEYPKIQKKSKISKKERSKQEGRCK